MEPLGYKDCPTRQIRSLHEYSHGIDWFSRTLAPFIGYWILSKLHVQAVALTGGLLIILACIAFECLRYHPRALKQN